MHAVIAHGKELDRDFINSMNRSDAQSFLESYRLFDGSQGRFHLYTSSEQRRDDLCQIALMAGWFVGVTEKTGGFNDKPCYELHIKTKHRNQRIFLGDVSKEFFVGKLYCVTVPEHRIVVREHGRGAVVTGNCGDAVESCIAKVLPKEPLPSNPFWAQAWAGFGVDVGKPIVGSIGVIRWSATSGHVGIVAGYKDGRVYLLGGNQSNAINVSSFAMGAAHKGFRAFRWPSTFPIRRYPAMRGNALPITSEGATR
jgi:hypothetical protein